MAANITVLYFASLADQADLDQECISVDDATTLPKLYAQLADKYGFTLDTDKLAVAINHHIASWQHAINDGDVIAFIPPVAGG